MYQSILDSMIQYPKLDNEVNENNCIPFVTLNKILFDANLCPYKFNADKTQELKECISVVNKFINKLIFKFAIVVLSSSKMYKLHMIDKITETDYSSNNQFIKKTTDFEL